MRKRFRSFGLACTLALLFAPVAGRGAEMITPEMQQALRGARTVRLEVKQVYNFPEPEPKEPAEGEAKAGEQTEKPGGEKEKAEPAEEKFSLPLEKLAAEAIKLTGWKQVGPDEKADVTLTIETIGTPHGANYVGALSGYYYTGADLEGSIRLELDGQLVAEVEISAKIPVAHSISSTSFTFQGSTPREAPFSQTLTKYCEAVFTLLGRACGPGPVVAGLKLEDFDQQTGAGRALLEVGDPTVEPALLEALGQDSDTLARLAALGLGVHGRATALPGLLAALRKDKSDASRLDYTDPFDDELLRSLTEEPDELVPPNERTAAARERLDAFGALHRAVEWALLQIESPGKFGQLAAALQEPDAVMLRRGAAVVLGGMAEPRAFEPLAAATRDKEPLVRVAAVAALSRIKDDRGVDVLLAASDDATGYVSKLAREKLEEAGKKRWEKFMGPRVKALNAAGEIPAPALLESLAHPDPLVRAAAAGILGYRSEPELKAGLAKVLRSDPRALVREAAARALAESREDSNAPLLAAALGDADAATRRQAVDALTGYVDGDDEAGKKSKRTPLPETTLAPVLDLLARKELGEEAAATLLGRIGGPGVADALLRALQEARSPEVLRLAARRLAERGDKRATAPLLALMGKAPEQSAGQYAADALAVLDDPAALEPLFVHLKSGSPAARRLAMSALGRMRQPRAIGPLIAAARAGAAASSGDPAEGQTGAAVEALETLTGKIFANPEEWLRWWRENSGKFVLPPKKIPPGDDAETPEPKKD